jgi:PAS domain S-box-containing protein
LLIIWVEEYEKFQIDEFIPVIIILSFSLSIFSLRRWSEIKHENKKRKQVEAALRESQRKLDTLINSLPGIVFSRANEPEWPLTYLSEGCLILTGYTSKELVGNGNSLYNSIIHAEDLPKVFNAIETAIALKQDYVVEYRIRTKSGQEKWLWDKGSGVFDSNGEVLGLEGFITDITERKWAEAALSESKRQLQEQNAVLMELSKRKTFSRGRDLNAAVREITEAATNTLKIERASVWLYNGERSKIQCLDLYEWSKSAHSQGIELAAVEYPAYFKRWHRSACSRRMMPILTPEQENSPSSIFLPSALHPCWMHQFG